MKLSVDLLDNDVKSAVINVGANSGYVEAYLTGTNLALLIYDKEGEIVLERFIPIKVLQAKEVNGWTNLKFEPTLD